MCSLRVGHGSTALGFSGGDPCQDVRLVSRNPTPLDSGHGTPGAGRKRKYGKKLKKSTKYGKILGVLVSEEGIVPIYRLLLTTLPIFFH